MTFCRWWIFVCTLAAMRLAAGTAAEDSALRLPPYPLGPVVMLADGGIVAGRLEAITPEQVEIDSPLLGKLTLPRDRVAGYRASMAVGPVPPRRPDKKDGQAAVVRLVNGDSVAASSLSARADEVTIRMTAPAAYDVVIPLESVRAIDFATAPAEPTLPRRLVALADGSRFAEASLPEACDPAVVVATLVEGDETELLTRLEPLAYEQGDAGRPDQPLARSTTLSGDWPAVRGTTAFTGMGMQAPARVRYQLAAPAHRFESLVAIDDSAGQGGSVIVRVRAIDVAGVGRDVYATPILWGGDEPHRIGVDLGGTVALELIVEPADGSTPLDRTIWLDPRVVFIPGPGSLGMARQPEETVATRP
jgi:hypothetical protein